MFFLFCNTLIQSISYQIHSAQSPCVSMFLFIFQDGMPCCGNFWAALPCNLILEAKRGGKQSASFFEYARIPVGNAVKNAYATMMSADICSLTSRDCLAARRKIFHIPLRFSFPNWSFFSIPESSSILDGGIKNCKAEKFRWEMKNHCIPTVIYGF